MLRHTLNNYYKFNWSPQLRKSLMYNQSKIAVTKHATPMSYPSANQLLLKFYTIQ